MILKNWKNNANYTQRRKMNTRIGKILSTLNSARQNTKNLAESQNEAEKGAYSNIKTIYFDVDGVIADFDKYAREHGVEGNDVKIDELMIKEVPNGLFRNLDLMHDASHTWNLMHKLRKKGYSVELLTAVGDPTKGKNPEPAIKDKKAWLDEYGFSTFKANFTFTGMDKAKFAKPSSLLIDDMHKNIAYFISAGGHAILHRSALETESKLRAMNIL